LGYLYSTSKDDIGYSLCVSGPQLAKNIISSNSDDTAIDLTTGLQWQKSSYPTAVAWAETSSICSAVSLSGKTDWRVPSISELASIIDFDKYSPTINTIIFSDTDSWPASKTFWSATTYYENAWFLRFEDGAVQHGNKEGMFYVRCVRTL
jgi:hypothetical protein